MEIYLAAVNQYSLNNLDIDIADLNILQSFYNIRKSKEDFIKKIIASKNFLLDSGTFSFLCGAKEVDFDLYIEQYADFINKYGIKNFFELDIDSFVGLKEVERLRDKLENLTGRKPIPVWHKNRSKEYFIEMCKKYPYVAIGGLATKEVKKKEITEVFDWFIQTAHKYNAKIHALGLSDMKIIYRNKFDSVDSCNWLYGNIGGHIYWFDLKTMMMKKKKSPQGKRIKSKEGATRNLREWALFVKYARYYL